MKIIDAEKAKSYGISTLHHLMDNGEIRFRLNASDGSAYIRTISGKDGAWQKSHYHIELFETYIVQKGWIALAEIENKRMTVKVFYENSIITTKQNVSHNIYLSSGSVIHTVKHGQTKEKDWYEDIELDLKTRSLTEKEILDLSV